MTCREATDLVHEFLDHELPESHHAAVRAHLEACPACWRKFEFEKELRDLIWEKGQNIQAPSQVKDRVIRNLWNQDAKPEQPQRRWVRWPKVSWGWVLPAVALISFIAAWHLFNPGPSGEVLLAELVGDHIQHTSAEKASEKISSNTEEVETWLEGKLGYGIEVPHFEGPDLHLVGGRFLTLRGRKIAYLIYRDGSHVLSLYVTKVGKADLCADNRLQLQDCRLCLARVQNCEFCLTQHRDYNILSWQENDITYAMISDLDSDHMLGVTCPNQISG